MVLCADFYDSVSDKHEKKERENVEGNFYSVCIWKKNDLLVSIRC